MGAHATYPPSSAEQWSNCTGWVYANAENPKPDTPESRDGTAAHWVCSETLAGSGTFDCSAFLGKTDPDGTVITAEMVDGAQVYVDAVVGACRSMQVDPSELSIETRVDMERISPDGDNWGTFDASLWVPDLKTLFLWDYKHGHRVVQAKNNRQMINYVEGLAQQYWLGDDVQVHITTVQPFAYKARGPVDTWKTTVGELIPFWHMFSEKIAESKRNPTLTTGLHCRDCAAVGKCSASRQTQYNLIHLAEQPYEMDTMSGHDLAVEYDILHKGVAVAKARLDAIEDQLKHIVANGDGSTGYTLETTHGREEYTVADDVVIALAKQFGVDATKPVVKTPNQLLKAAPTSIRAAFGATLNSIKRRKAGSLKLTRFEDSKVRRAFQPKKEV